VGLQEGDVLVAVNGIRSRGLTHNTTTALMDLHPHLLTIHVLRSSSSSFICTKIKKHAGHRGCFVNNTNVCALTHTRTHPFNGPFSGTTRVSRYQKGKPIWILLKQELVSGSGISWTVCKSAPCTTQITTPAPHHSVFTGRMPLLPPNQQRQSTEALRAKID